MTPAWCFHLLGPMMVSYGGKAVNVGGPTAKALLATLLLRGDSYSGTDELIENVWGAPGGTTRDTLYQYVRSLRTALSIGPGLEFVTGR
ncbi:MAG: helix-turn-helix domain-containing protein, partial [Actinobacteria bacterium]